MLALLTSIGPLAFTDLHLALLCGGLTEGQLEGKDGHSRPGQRGGVPGPFTWDTPGGKKMKRWINYRIYTTSSFSITGSLRARVLLFFILSPSHQGNQ